MTAICAVATSPEHARNCRSRRIADVADRGLGRLNWAESAPTRVASGRTGVASRSRHSIASAKYASPPEADLGQPRQQRHAPLRSPAFPGVGEKPSSARRKDGVRVGGAAGRLVELREWERRQEFVAPRALRLRHSYGDLEGLFGRRRVRVVALEQKITAEAMKIGVREMLARSRSQSPIPGRLSASALSSPRASA